jgi:DNA-binding NtrC family response regulator
METMFLNNSSHNKGRKILIIDDDATLCSVFKDILDHSGYQTFIAQKEEDVLSIINQETVDLAYVDLEMPELNSSAISNQIKRANPNTLVVLISGYPLAHADDEISLTMKEGVIDKFVDKGDLFNLPSITEKLLSERPN